MMSWIKSQTSGTSPPNMTVSMDRKKVEPGATYSLFEDHWAQAVQVMQSSKDSEGAYTVVSHLSQMIAFLVMTRGEQVTSEKSCKGFWLQHRCSDQVIRWLHNLQVQGTQLSGEDEMKLIAMLHSLCEAASRDGELLGYVRNLPSSTDKDHDQDHWDGAYALASLLLEYSLRDTIELAQTARYSFIQLIQLSSKYPALERSLSHESGLGLTNVVVSGLSACFAQLPTFTAASSAQLTPFIEQLKFVNDVTTAANDFVAATIADCFTNVFLLAVIEPALTQSLNEEIGLVTYYFELICRNVTHPVLVKSLVHFVNTRLLSILIHRLNTNESVSVNFSTLSLFNTLLESYCEDFWMEVILKYLTPQHHLMVSQRKQRLPPIDFYDSSTHFLSILPLRLCEIIGPYTIEGSFIQYINQASTNWKSFQANLQIPLDITRIAEGKVSINPIFSYWKHPYDGTESEEGVSILNGILTNHDNLNENQEDENRTRSNSKAIQVHEHKEVDTVGGEVINNTRVFTTISLENGYLEDSIVTPPVPPKVERFSILTNQSDGYASMESGGVQDDDGSTVASLGPFLDSLLVQLSNWPHLDLDIILVVTQIVTMLAASKIPLISSFLLDPSVTLQPYYLTFHTLLKRIQEDLEYQLKDVSPEVIRSVWNTHCTNGEDLNSTGPSMTISIPASFSGHVSDTFRRTIGGGGAEAIANVWRMFNRKSQPVSSPIAKVQVHPSSGRVARDDDEVKPDPEVEAQKKMVLRLVYFFHWLLELGAVAQQQCWRQAYA